VYRSRGTYEPTAKFTTWLFRIATHLALNWLRDGKNEKGQSGWMTIPASRGAMRWRTASLRNIAGPAVEVG
jgi:DNA-directed RNA polymerase specialized sigma24 family protein